MNKIEILSYEREYIHLTKELKESNIVSYTTVLYKGILEEINKGMKAAKVNEPTRSGTKILYKPLKDEEDFNNTINKINKELKAFNKKHSTDLKIITGAK